MKNLEFANRELKRVYFMPNMVEELTDYFLDHKDAVLIIDFTKFMDFKNPDCLEYINRINPKRLLMASGQTDNIRNVDALLKIPCLTELYNVSLDLAYDFLNFPNLEYLIYKWDKSCRNLSSLSKLKELSLWSYKSTSKDMTDFSGFCDLEELRIIQSNVASIKGIESLKNLKDIIFIANRDMSLKGIDSVFKEVDSLHIEGCKNIDDSFVKIFPNVKRLEFINNAELESLRNILEGLKQLEYLNVAGTKILEEDNWYWKDFTSIKAFNFTDRKHHKMKLSDLGKV